MRVLHVIPSVGLVRGGPSQAVLELVRAVRPLGVDAEILCTNDDGPGLLEVPLGTLGLYKDVPVRFFPRFSPRFRPLREFAYSAPFAPWLRKHLRGFDLLHVHSLFSYLPSVAMRIARRLRVPCVVRPSGLLCRWSLQQSRLRKQIFLTLFERANLNGCAAIEYTAEQEREETADLGLQSPTFVMPYGLHLAEPIPDAGLKLRKQFQIAYETPVILFLSRLHPKKGAHLLIEALKGVADRPFTLIVAGSGSPEYEAQLKSMVTGGSLNSRVCFVGFAQGEFKQLLLQGADFFALTSHSESFGIAAMEAMAAGIPVLLTPGVPLARLVRKFDAGWVTELNKAAIASTATQALDSLAGLVALKARRQRCRALAANFEWTRIAARMMTIYEAVLRQRPLPSFELAQVAL